MKFQLFCILNAFRQNKQEEVKKIAKGKLSLNVFNVYERSFLGMKKVGSFM